MVAFVNYIVCIFFKNLKFLNRAVFVCEILIFCIFGFQIANFYASVNPFVNSVDRVRW